MAVKIRPGFTIIALAQPGVEDTFLKGVVTEVKDGVIYAETKCCVMDGALAPVSPDYKTFNTPIEGAVIEDVLFPGRISVVH